MKKNVLVLLLIILAIGASFAQNQANIWHFGNHGGLNFNTGEPIVINNIPFSSAHACASMSDQDGNFLFSCNGQTIWNRNMQIMQNGDGLIGNSFASQGALIIQRPDSFNQYYVFTVAAFTNPVGVHYSIVDMSLDGGLGAVTNEKNISMNAAWDALEKLTSVRHSNGIDIWVITRKFSEDAFASFLLTSSGIATEPVISPTIDRGSSYISGSMKVSHDKQYIVIAYQEENANHYNDQAFEICSFNPLTGEIELLYTLTRNDEIGAKRYEPWAVEFSPDSKLLYLTYYNEDNMVESMELFQYDMQYIEDSAQFAQLGVHIATGPVNGLQLARDGKIYCTGDNYNSYDYVSVIHEPWKRGVDCNFEADAIYIGQDMVYRFLPNILTDYLFRFEWEGSCSGPDNIIKFQPNFIPTPASITWSFGDFSFSTELYPEHIYEYGGKYDVSVNVTYPNGRFEHTSRIITVNESPHPNLGTDTLLCEGTQVTLNAGNEQGFYAWSDGTTFGHNIFNLTVSDTGTYWVQVTNTEGCNTRDSIHVGWFNKAVFNESNIVITPTSCGGSNGSIAGIQIDSVVSVSTQWYDGNGNLIGNTLNIGNLSVGNYFLHVTDTNGCVTISDSYTVTDAGDILITAVEFSPSHCSQSIGSISITASSGAGNSFLYSIQNGASGSWQTDSLFTGLPYGEYFIKVKDQSGCETVYDNNPVVIENIAGPQVTTINITNENDYSSDGSINIEAIINIGDIQYSIDSGYNFQPNNGLFENLSAGTYYCVVQDEFGCDTSFIIEIDRIISQIIDAIAGGDSTCIGNATASPLLLNNFTNVSRFHVMLTYDEDLIICDGYMQVHPDLEDSLQVSINNTGEVHISWQGQSPISLPDNSLMTELVFGAIDEGLSQVDWVANQGESQFFNEYGEQINTNYQLGNIRIYTRPNIILGTLTEVCEGEMTMISPFIDGGSGENSSHWDGPNNFTSDNELLWINEATSDMSGIYTLTVTDTINCIESKSMELIVNQEPTVAFSEYDTLWVDPGYILEAGYGAEFYQWNTGETTETIVIDSIGSYNVEVTSYEGCKSTDTVQILWGGAPFYLPNAFTPNGDGLNDTFGPIPRYDYVNRYHMSIFNRWGQMIFETTDINQGWAGSYQGSPVMMGAYVYRIVYEEFSNHPMESKFVEGTVMLVR